MNNLQSVYKEIAQELNIPEKTVSKVCQTYWQFIRDKIESLPLQEIKDVEELKTLKTSFIIPGFGRFYVPKERFKNFKRNDKGKED